MNGWPSGDGAGLLRGIEREKERERERERERARGSEKSDAETDWMGMNDGMD
jgi:hypothetical protein